MLMYTSVGVVEDHMLYNMLKPLKHKRAEKQSSNTFSSKRT